MFDDARNHEREEYQPMFWTAHGNNFSIIRICCSADNVQTNKQVKLYT
jgi:hypothetical protein